MTEKMVAGSQGRAYPVSEVHPRRLAVWLAKRVVRTPWGIGLGIPETMEMAIREVGTVRILFAAAVSVVSKKVFRRSGDFYRIAGPKARGIDGPGYPTIPPYDEMVVLTAAKPKQTSEGVRDVIATHGIREPEARFDLVRFGSAAFGVSPFDDVDGPGLGLRGTVTLRASVLDVTADGVVLDVGAADGIPPSVPAASGSGAEVLLAGRRARVLAVEVDTLRVEAVPGAAVGDVALVYGPGDTGEPTVENWAAWAGTIGDEILARASLRIPRVIEG